MGNVRLGLRERKKERTRQVLIDTAAELFDGKGYRATTLAEIAAESEVSRSTIFSYFASKEELLFAGTEARLRVALEAVADRRPGDRPIDALNRAMRAAMRDLMAESDRMAPVRVRLVLGDPGLQRVAFQRMFGIQRSLARRLHEVFPDHIDAMGAAALVGALVGAYLGAVAEFAEDPAELERLLAQDADRMWTRIRLAVDAAGDGLAASPPDGP